MPPAQRRCSTSMLMTDPVQARIRELDAITVAGPAKGLCAEGKRHRSADVVSHFLSDHGSVDTAPVPLLVIGGAKVVDAVDDDGLDLEARSPVLIPDAHDPEIEVGVNAGLVDVCIALVVGWQVETVGWDPRPVFWQALLPGCHEEVDGDCIFEDVIDFYFGSGRAREAKSILGARAKVGNVDCGGGEAGGGILGEGLEDGREAVRAAVERSAFFDGVFDELSADCEEETNCQGRFAISSATVFDESGRARIMCGSHAGFRRFC